MILRRAKCGQWVGTLVKGGINKKGRFLIIQGGRITVSSGRCLEVGCKLCRWWGVGDRRWMVVNGN